MPNKSGNGQNVIDLPNFPKIFYFSQLKFYYIKMKVFGPLVSSVRTVLWHQVRIPFAPSMLSRFILLKLKLLLWLGWEKDKNKLKEPGIGRYLKKNLIEFLSARHCRRKCNMLSSQSVWPVKKYPNVYKSCQKMISLEKFKDFDTLQKLPKVYEIWAN